MVTIETAYRNSATQPYPTVPSPTHTTSHPPNNMFAAMPPFFKGLWPLLISSPFPSVISCIRLLHGWPLFHSPDAHPAVIFAYSVVASVTCFPLSSLAEWRQEELMRIDETLSGAERKAALCMLLDQETQLLASIGKHKVEADAENREKFIQDFLEKVSTEWVIYSITFPWCENPIRFNFIFCFYIFSCYKKHHYYLYDQVCLMTTRIWALSFLSTMIETLCFAVNRL